MWKKACLGFFLSLVAIIPGCLSETPNSPAPPLSVHKIAIYGDSRTGNDIHQQIVNQIMEKEPDLVFHTGDMVEDGNNRSDWQIFDNITRALQDSSEFFPCLGNHENESPLYFSYFGIPESMRWYSTNRFGIHFVVLDSNWELGAGSQQYNWLANDLSGSNANLKIVILHHPLYSATRNDPLYDQFRNTLIPVFEQNHVKVVFSGHEHNYERFYAGGIYYIITGGGGAPLYEQLLTNTFLEKFVMQNHFCFLTYDGNNLEIKVYNERGDQIDQFSVNPN